MRKLPLGLLIGILLAAAGGADSRASYPYGSQHTYFGPEGSAIYRVEYRTGFNYPQWNRVYRPLYKYFSIYYTDGTSRWGFKRNFLDNPLVWPYAGGYGRSACIHSDDNFQAPQYPVTCQHAT